MFSMVVSQKNLEVDLEATWVAMSRRIVPGVGDLCSEQQSVIMPTETSVVLLHF